MTETDLEPCGWPFIVGYPGLRCEIGGVDLWKDDMAWMNGAVPCGSVFIRDIDQSVRCYQVLIGGRTVRVAVGEISQGKLVVASNDVALRILD